MITLHAPLFTRSWRLAAAICSAVVLAAATAAAVSAVTLHSLASAKVTVNTAAVNTSAVNTSAVNTAGFPSGGRNSGIFTDTCTLTKTLPNDPIMMPGMTGMSMQHDFFGNPAVSASSVPKDLVGGSSSCTTTADASAYWTPVLYSHGVPLVPKSTLIYWRAPAESAATVKTMPAGISMIAGKENATTPQSDRIIDWTCTSAVAGRPAARGNVPRDCDAGQQLRLVITFPNCWDGHTLDGKAQTNVVYATAGGCPASHPVQVPQIVMHLTYPTSSASGLTLSVGPTKQGSTVTGHADFQSGWNQSRMDADVSACIDAQTRCGRTVGPLATPQGARRPSA